jgi:surface protein
MDNLLINWSALPSVKPYVILSAPDSYYGIAGIAGYTTLTSAPDNWTITVNGASSFFSITVTVTNNQLFSVPFKNINITGAFWGDGTINTSNSHTYSYTGTPATYTATFYSDGLIDPSQPAQLGGQVYSHVWDSPEFLTAVNKWYDPNSVTITNFVGAFYACINLISVPTSLPPGVTYIYDMFVNASSFNSPIGNWDISSVNNMQQLFTGASSFNQDISSWDVSNIFGMSAMFSGASSFNQPIGNWNVSQVSGIGDMFNYATSFNQDISSWNIRSLFGASGFLNGATSFSPQSNTTHMDNLLTQWAALPSIPSYITLSADDSFYSNAGVAGYNTLTSAPYNWTITAYLLGPHTFLILTINVTSTNQFKIPLSNVNNLSVSWGDGTIDTNLSHTYSYSGTPQTYTIEVTGFLLVNNTLPARLGGDWGSPEFLTGVTQWYYKGTGFAITDFSNGFFNCTNLLVVPKKFPPNVTNTSYMFSGATSFNQFVFIPPSVTDLSNMFSGATSFNQFVPFPQRGTDLSNMFSGATSFNQDLYFFQAVSITDMHGMFNGAVSFNGAIVNLNATNVTNMSNLFNNATSFNQDISSWNVSNVTNMSNMLTGATSFSPQSNTTHMDNLLTNWSQLSSIQTGVTLDAPDSYYGNAGAAGYTTLTSAPDNWTINTNHV